MTIKSFLIEKKNQHIFMLGLGMVVLLIVFIFLFLLITLIIRSSAQSKKQKESGVSVKVSPIPTRQTIPSNSDEIVKEAGYSIDCQIVVTTNLRKIYVKKLEKCSQKLNYTISLTNKFIAYLLYDNKKTARLFVYSLDNNADALLQVINDDILDYQFDQKENLLVLFSKKDSETQQSAMYFFNTLLFSEYPGNYYKELRTFTNIEKRKLDIVLPEVNDVYKKIIVKQDELDLVNGKNSVLYVMKLVDLEIQLSPTPPPAVNKDTLDWDKRIVFMRNGQFLTMDTDGSNEVAHQFICEGIEVVPINYDIGLFSRSPDGQTLAFLIPTEDQMKENTNWKSDILSKKRVFKQGEIVIYDLVKGECQKTAVVQTIGYGETFSFSPNGIYLAFVNKGVSLYNLQDHQDYSLSYHNPSSESDMTAVTGPLIWDGDSKFIYTSISKIQNNIPVSTKLVRAYFNERLEGTEQEIINLSPSGNLYAVSPDGSKILYKQGKTIYKYDIDSQKNSLFNSGSDNPEIKKLMWLRNNTIVSNAWIGNESLRFIPLPELSKFDVGYDGDLLIYNPLPNTPQYMKLYDLSLKKERLFKDKKILEGELITWYY